MLRHRDAPEPASIAALRPLAPAFHRLASAWPCDLARLSASYRHLDSRNRRAIAPAPRRSRYLRAIARRRQPLAAPLISPLSLPRSTSIPLRATAGRLAWQPRRRAQYGTPTPQRARRRGCLDSVRGRSAPEFTKARRRPSHSPSPPGESGLNGEKLPGQRARMTRRQSCPHTVTARILATPRAARTAESPRVPAPSQPRHHHQAPRTPCRSRDVPGRSRLRSIPRLPQPPTNPGSDRRMYRAIRAVSAMPGATFAAPHDHPIRDDLGTLAAGLRLGHARKSPCRGRVNAMPLRPPPRYRPAPCRPAGTNPASGAAADDPVVPVP